MNPYLRIISNKVSIDYNSRNNLISPFNLYDFITQISKSKDSYSFEAKSCEQAHIPLRFCKCPDLNDFANFHDTSENL